VKISPAAVNIGFYGIRCGFAQQLKVALHDIGVLISLIERVTGFCLNSFSISPGAITNRLKKTKIEGIK
jgi:hypothetical protein